MQKIDNLNKIIAGNPFKGSGSLVLRKLLSDPTRQWTAFELAKELGLNNSWCNKVLNALESEKIIERGGRGLAAFTKLIDPENMLKQWTTIYRWPKNTFHSFITKEHDPVAKLADAANNEGWLYAATGKTALRLQSGKQLEGPETVYLTPKEKGYTPYRVMLKKLQRHYGFYKVLNNPDIQIVEPYLGTSVYFERSLCNGIHCVSELQLKLDYGNSIGGI